MRMAILALAGLAGSPALAQPAGPPRAINTNVAPVDARFVSEAAVGNLGAIALAELAMRRGSPEVRDVARMIRDDRQYLARELRAIVERERLTLPAQLPPQQQILRNELAVLRGKDFDRAYLEVVRRDEQRDVALFRAQAQQGVDPALRNYAQAMLRPLRFDAQVASRSAQRL
jgi:putative membrane protein